MRTLLIRSIEAHWVVIALLAGPWPTRGIHAQTGALVFAELDRLRVPASYDWAFKVEALDVDADGDLDLYLGNHPHDRLYLNDGHGRLEDVTSTHLPAASFFSSSFASGDLDGDGDLDLVLGYPSAAGTANLLLLNDGVGRFSDGSSGRLPLAAGFTEIMDLGDVDGDGDLDLVTLDGFRALAPKLYRNDGSAHFASAGAGEMPAIWDPPRELELADLDRDGDLDLFVGCLFQSHLLQNDGHGRFLDVTAQALPWAYYQTESLGLADFDADGDIDVLLAAGYGLSEGSPDVLYLNDGTGCFTLAPPGHLVLDHDWALDVAIADVDGDGDLDYATGNIPNYNTGLGGQNRLYLNDGRAHFVDVTAASLPVARLFTYALVLADLDGDRDADLFEANGAVDRDVLYYNLMQHVHAPREALLGAAYRLDFYARDMEQRTFHVALALLGVATARIEIPPFGTLGIDPRASFLLSPLYIAPPGGMASVAAILPADPAHLGTPIAAQALILDPLGPGRFTNTSLDLVR